MDILILEDEIPAYEKLASYLEDAELKKIEHDWARSVNEGKSLLENNSYDLIFSDIQLLDGLSFDLFEKKELECPIIFCSAHDEYLFEAFRTNGIAYILKPYSKDDFNEALNKYLSLFKTSQSVNFDTILIQELKNALKSEAKNFKERYVIKRPNGIQLLSTSKISLIQAEGDFSIAFDEKGNKHPISKNLGTIEQELPPDSFFRVNRSQIINIEYILSIEKHFKNRLIADLKGNKEKVMTSSSVTADFRKWLER